MSPDYGQKIAEAFEEYLRTGEVELIENFTAEQLKTAISHLSPHYDKNRLWYRAIESRIEELSSLAKRNKTKIWEESINRKWIERVLIFLLGVLGGLALNL